MRRLLASSIVVACLLCATPALASARPDHRPPPVPRALLELLARQHSQWLLGSSTNPLVNGVCGEAVHGIFFLTASTAPGTELDCTVPRGMPIVATPGGTFVWQAGEAISEAALMAQMDDAQSTITDPTASLDGRALPFTLVRTPRPYRVHLEPGNFLETVDPTTIVRGRTAQVATTIWESLIRPLPRGSHELVLSDSFDGEVYDITFHLTVS